MVHNVCDSAAYRGERLRLLIVINDGNIQFSIIFYLPSKCAFSVGRSIVLSKKAIELLCGLLRLGNEPVKCGFACAETPRKLDRRV